MLLCVRAVLECVSSFSVRVSLSNSGEMLEWETRSCRIDDQKKFFFMIFLISALKYLILSQLLIG